MKKLFNAIRNKAQSLAVRTHTLIQDGKGDLATNTIGAIIVAVVIIGLLVVAINAFFPPFFTDMFNGMKTRLNSNW